MSRADNKRRGFALVPALFLIVVLAALGAAAIRIGNGEQQTVTMALQQARALAAARAGIEWGAYNALVSPSRSCAPSTTLNLSEAALAGFTVVVTCSPATDNSVSPSKNVYVLVASSSSGTYGQPGYVHRVVSATFTDATG